MAGRDILGALLAVIFFVIGILLCILGYFFGCKHEDYLI
jgi:uncharacterized membrane protein YqaE (UPF0057 family)